MFGIKLVYCVLLVGAAFQAVSATVISSPASGVVWQSNSQQEVRWNTPTEPTVDVRLVKGRPENLIFVGFLCQNVQSSAGVCKFKVPVVKSGIDYAVTVGKAAANYAYSSYFDIHGDGPMPRRTGCPKMGGQNCPRNLPCCSASGYCGATPAHCGSGCMKQYSFNGVCAKAGSKPPTPRPAAKCGNKTCSKTKPCCNRKTNTCTNSTAGCKNCNAQKSFQRMCKRYRP